jgi:imidazolonepropionase-like amidohydrolase
MKLARPMLLLVLAVAAPDATAGAADAPRRSLAIRGTRIHTMAGPAIDDGVVLIVDGKITAIGERAATAIPDGFEILEAAMVTPGFVDARATVGLTGWLNQPHDQDQFDRSEAIQPELRAVDAYNARDPLVAWLRGFGVTTVHTGHAPGPLVAGQTMIAKTRGDTVEDAVIVECAAIAATLSSIGRGESRGKGPGSRAKAAALLRQALLDAREKPRGRSGEDGEGDEDGEAKDEDREPARNLRHEALRRVLAREIPLLVTADRHQDIATALRIGSEFGIDVVIDSGAEAWSMLDAIAAANVPVLVHPVMARPQGDRRALRLDGPALLHGRGIAIALTSGYESYVPKTRVVPFEAAMATAGGLPRDAALAAITIDAARLLKIDSRLGSLEVGKDGDVALFDGDPFEWTTRCVGVVIEGEAFPGEE